MKVKMPVTSGITRTGKSSGQQIKAARKPSIILIFITDGPTLSRKRSSRLSSRSLNGFCLCFFAICSLPFLRRYVCVADRLATYAFPQWAFLREGWVELINNPAASSGVSILKLSSFAPGAGNMTFRDLRWSPWCIERRMF